MGFFSFFCFSFGWCFLRPFTKHFPTDRINAESKSRKPAQLKGAAKYLKQPGLISLGGGLPCSDYFPFEELSLKVPTPGHFSEPTDTTGQTVVAGKHDLVQGKSIFDISTAFNYGQGSGSAQMVRFLTEHTEIVHNPPYADWQCTMTIGSTSALDMILRMFRHPNMCMLTEEYTFSTAIEAARPLGVEPVGVAMDDEGLLPASLDTILSQWDPEAHNSAPKPFLLYVVPTGQNPTGATLSHSRRKELYAVAQKHDLLIIEDEPYYFLQMPPYTGGQSGAAPATTTAAPLTPPPAPASHASFLASLVPSLLSMDTDGRVIRLDSLSKVIAPGSRLGWITAPAQICERYYRHADVSTQGPCGISQLVVWKLLDDTWGHAGYLDWLVHVRLEYTRRRDGILAACEEFLPQEVVAWKPPMAGMFHWIEIHGWRRHALAGELGLLGLEERIWLKGVELGALVIRGSWFVADRGVEQQRMFFRTTYAAAPFDRIREAIRRFGQAVREEFGLVAAGVGEGEGEGGKGVVGSA